MKEVKMANLNRILLIVNFFSIVFSITVSGKQILAQEDAGIDDLKIQIESLRNELKQLEKRVDDTQKTEAETDGLLNVYAPGLKSLRIGGDMRVRFEGNSNFDFDDSKGDGKEFTLLRTRLNFDAEVNDHIRGFLEFQDNRLFGEAADAPALDEFAAGPPLTLAGTNGGTIGNLDRVDVLQSYVDVSLFERESSNYDAANLSFRIGRWRLKYGGQKIISPLDWLNQGRAWDGIRMRYEQDSWAMPFWVDIFATQLDEDFIDAGRGGEDEDKIFTGIYGHLDWQNGHEIEPYLLYRRSKGGPEIDPVDSAIRPFPRPDGLQGSTRRTNEERTTLGVRVHGKLVSMPGLEYTGEFVTQFGSVNGDGIENLDIEDAFGGYAEISYTKEDWSWKPQIGYAFHFASGDDDPNDDEIGTFDQIYPLSHAYLGYIDFQGWQNVIGHQFTLSAKPLEKMLAKIDFHFFELEEDNDAWFGASGAPNGGFRSAAVSGADADKEIGQEIDVTLKYKLFERLNVTMGYSHFFAGDMIDDVTGDDDDADWFYLMTSLKF